MKKFLNKQTNDTHKNKINNNMKLNRTKKFLLKQQKMKETWKTKEIQQEKTTQ